jgi:hypothetical protein
MFPDTNTIDHRLKMGQVIVTGTMTVLLFDTAYGSSSDIIDFQWRTTNRVPT